MTPTAPDVAAAWARYERALIAEGVALGVAGDRCWNHDRRQEAYPGQREQRALDAARALGLWGHMLAESAAIAAEWQALYLQEAA